MSWRRWEVGERVEVQHPLTDRWVSGVVIEARGPEVLGDDGIRYVTDGRSTVRLPQPRSREEYDAAVTAEKLAWAKTLKPGDVVWVNVKHDGGDRMCVERGEVVDPYDQSRTRFGTWEVVDPPEGHLGIGVESGCVGDFHPVYVFETRPEARANVCACWRQYNIWMRGAVPTFGDPWDVQIENATAYSERTPAGRARRAFLYAAPGGVRKLAIVGPDMDDVAEAMRAELRSRPDWRSLEGSAFISESVEVGPMFAGPTLYKVRSILSPPHGPKSMEEFQELLATIRYAGVVWDQELHGEALA